MQNKINFLSIVFVFLFFLQGCNTIKEGFKSPKENNSDEFLVQKKLPLSMPPEYNELPKPKLDNDDEIQENNIKNLIITSENDVIEAETNQELDKELESLVLDQIKNN